MVENNEVWSLEPWVPMNKPIDLKVLGKFLEELGEATSATARCLIQGIDEKEPVTKKVNRQWLQDEIADVLGNLNIVVRHFGLDMDAIYERAARKQVNLEQWHKMS